MLGPATTNIGPATTGKIPHGNTTWLKSWRGPVCSGKGLTGTVFSEKSFLNMNGELVHNQNLENGTCVFNPNYQHLNKLIDWNGRIGLRIFCIFNLQKISFRNFQRADFPVRHSPAACTENNEDTHFIIFGIKSRVLKN